MHAQTFFRGVRFARSVRESICLQFIRTDLAPSSLGLYENLRQILSRTDRFSSALNEKTRVRFGCGVIYFTILLRDAVMAWCAEFAKSRKTGRIKIVSSTVVRKKTMPVISSNGNQPRIRHPFRTWEC